MIGPAQVTAVVIRDALDRGGLRLELAGLVEELGAAAHSEEVELHVRQLARAAVVLAEGFQFGEQALKMITYFKMKPQTKDGAPVGGASVVIPIAFNGS